MAANGTTDLGPGVASRELVRDTGGHISKPLVPQERQGSGPGLGQQGGRIGCDSPLGNCVHQNGSTLSSFPHGNCAQWDCTNTHNLVRQVQVGGAKHRSNTNLDNPCLHTLTYTSTHLQNTGTHNAHHHTKVIHTNTHNAYTNTVKYVLEKSMQEFRMPSHGLNKIKTDFNLPIY